MPDRFNDPSRRLMDLAKAEAEALGHAQISTEHVLLALASEPESDAMGVLKSLGAEPAAIRAAVLELVPRGDAPKRPRLPFTPDAKRMLEAMLNAAQALASNRLESTHLLLGLVSNPDFVSARALARLGLDLARVRNAVLTR